MYISTEQISVVVKILKNYEDCLSDGYKYYCGEDKVDKVLEEMAVDVIKELNKRKK